MQFYYKMFLYFFSNRTYVIYHAFSNNFSFLYQNPLYFV
ncbi:hypothetical protein CoNPh17_CDS0128 [Staphylococcus phage S-CoN_Ph17]|nr:hypothetical protein CoNPh17_CDS0128 [Staphylococcus phage S-CoN_Ph17]